jgi:putative sterol carrier protein
MTVFQSTEQASAVFTRLFEILLQDPTFGDRMRAAGLTLRLVQSKPELQLFVSPDGVSGDDIDTPAAITIKMSCDTAHQLWSGKLLMPLALATGKVRIRGSVAKVLEFVPLLQPAFDRYPEIAAQAGAPAAS